MGRKSLENNDNLHNKRIDISSNSTGGWHYTIDFYRYHDESNGSFKTRESMGDYYINDNTATLTDTRTNKTLVSITINDDKTIDFSANNISFNTTDYKITHLYDVNDIKDRELSWKNACNNTGFDNDYNDTFTIFKSGLISNRNDEIAHERTENAFVKKFYSNQELNSEFDDGKFNNYRDTTTNEVYQYNTGLRKSSSVSYEQVYVI